MNEKTIIYGDDKNHKGCYALFANENLVCTGKTPIEAIKNLLIEKKVITKNLGYSFTKKGRD